MEEKHRDTAVQPSPALDSPAPESTSSRRRSGGLKRKVNSLSTSNSTPSSSSKRVTREKANNNNNNSHNINVNNINSNIISNLASSHHSNGPLTRARQVPASHVAERAVASENLVAARVEEVKKEREWEALEAEIEAGFEGVRSRGVNVHVVPNHCGEILCLCLFF